ncbi:MAG: hypothetical protein ACE14V_08360 [bacterium]
MKSNMKIHGRICLLTIIAVCFLSTGAFCYLFGMNKHLYNYSGDTAWDLTLITQNTLPPTYHIDDPFGRYTTYLIGTSLRIFHWSNPIPSGGIPPGTDVHVGLQGQGEMTIVDMYWTDTVGQRLPKSVVWNANSRIGWQSETGTTFIYLDNSIAPVDSTGNIITESWATTRNVMVSGINYVVVDTPFPLSDLNENNGYLNDTVLQPIFSGTTTIPPGGQIQFAIPTTVQAGQFVVIRWDNVALAVDDSDSTQATDWVQLEVQAATTTVFNNGFNKDVINWSTATAYDLVIVLDGSTTSVTNHFDGYSSSYHFHDFAHYAAGDYTLCHWTSPNSPVPVGGTIHIGLSGTGAFKIIDMYWTDTSGNRLAKSVVWNATTKVRYENGYGILCSNPVHPVDTSGNLITASWATARAVTLSDIRYAVVTIAYALEELNAANTTLNNTVLQSLYAGSTTIPSDGEIEFAIPTTVQAGQYIIVRWDNIAPAVNGSDSTQATDWVQLEIIPTTQVEFWQWYSIPPSVSSMPRLSYIDRPWYTYEDRH